MVNPAPSQAGEDANKITKTYCKFKLKNKLLLIENGMEPIQSRGEHHGGAYAKHKGMSDSCCKYKSKNKLILTRGVWGGNPLN